MFPANFLTTMAFSFLLVSALAQEAPAPTSTMREISPGVFEIGKLRLDQTARTVTFPGALNMKEGNLEYLLVTPQGSAHESLLVSEIAPTEVHFAMLLLGAKGADTGEVKDHPPAQIDAKFLKNAPKLKGEEISISVRWKSGDVEKDAPVEDWIFDTATKKAMERGPWIYNGSMFRDDHFLAQIEGAHAALVTYPSALINNPRKGNDDDSNMDGEHESRSTSQNARRNHHPSPQESSAMKPILALTLVAALATPALLAAEPPARNEANVSVRNEVLLAIDKGLAWLQQQQKEDGSIANPENAAPPPSIPRSPRSR